MKAYLPSSDSALVPSAHHVVRCSSYRARKGRGISRRVVQSLPSVCRAITWKSNILNSCHTNQQMLGKAAQTAARCNKHTRQCFSKYRAH